MTLGALAAIRAIVAVHATYNRDRLLAVIDAAIDRERARQPVPKQLEEEEGIVGQVQTKIDPPEPYLAVRLDGGSHHQTVRSLDG